MTIIHCDTAGCKKELAAIGQSDVARATLTKIHGWKCDDRERSDLCPECANKKEA